MTRANSLLLVTALGLAFTPRIILASDAVASPAEQSIAKARLAIQSNPKDYEEYNLLANALMTHAQETSDASYLGEADSAVKKAMELTHGNFETRKMEVSLLLAEHDFPAALEKAKALNREVPDDVTVYGMVTDADIALGNYSDAENAAQWMLNLRPANLPALIRAARLRQLFGEIDGAYELLDLAYQSTSPADPWERASILTQMAQLRLMTDRTDAAEKLLEQALGSVPAYPAALGAMAEVRIQQHNLADAVTFLKQQYQQAPRAANLFELAKGLQLAGLDAEARQAFSKFEHDALQEWDKRDNANRDLIFYYADYAHQPMKALDIAKREVAWRRDVHTLDAYAWALQMNGQNAEARKQIETALSVGIQDATIFRHAGEIALASGDADAAKIYLRKSMRFALHGSE